MSNLKILLLHFEHILEHRSRSFVWSLLAMVNPLILILFWRGAVKTDASQITFSELTTYYFLLIFATSFLISHIEEDVAYYDIKQGNLVSYLLKPISYFWKKFYEELPYRSLQGFFGLTVIGLFYLFFAEFFTVSLNFRQVILVILIAALAHFISFTFKMIVGILAFWFTHVGGLLETMYVVSIIFNGSILPLPLMPETLRNLAFHLPFAYMVFYPVYAFLGKFNQQQLAEIILQQSAWLIFLLIIYKLLWNSGIKKFTGVGQ